MSEQTGAIFAAIPRVMGEIGAVSKARKNQAQGYSFRGIDDMYNAVQPAMVKHGVFCAPEVIDRIREERQGKSGGLLFYTTLTVRHRFYASDGTFVDVVTVGEAMDSGDKSTNKAMSAAMKYALIELFSIPTEEDNDSESHSHEVAPHTNPAAVERAKKEAEEKKLEDECVDLYSKAKSRRDLDMITPTILLMSKPAQARMRPYHKGALERIKQLEAANGITDREPGSDD